MTAAGKDLRWLRIDFWRPRSECSPFCHRRTDIFTVNPPLPLPAHHILAQFAGLNYRRPKSEMDDAAPSFDRYCSFGLALLCAGLAAPARGAGFDKWVEGFWPTAKAAGVSRATYDAAFHGVTP